MSSTTIIQHSHRAAGRRPAVDVLVEKLARRLLQWSERHTQEVNQASVNQPSHERVQLIREVEQVRFTGGSPFGR